MSYLWSASYTASLPLSAGVPLGRAVWVAGSRTEPAASPLAFAVVTERSAFDALEPEWNDLFRRAGRDTQLFQTFNWNWHWANHYLGAQSGERRGLAIVTVRSNGRLVMLWPLVRERTAGLDVLRWMGEPVSQYGDMLAEATPDTLKFMRQAWHYISSELGADAVVLRKVRADAVVAPLMRELGLQPTAAEQAPCLDLGSARGFAAYEERHSAKARKNRRRLMRRLQERGRVSVERCTGGNRARAAALEAITLKRASLEATGRLSPAMADRRFAAFFADAVDGRVRPTGCGVTVLACNGEAAGIAIDITCAGRRAGHVIVHDPRFDDCGAGLLLLQEWIKGACADALTTFDLLAPAHAYKLDWADRTVAVEDFAVGITLAGRAYADVYLGVLRERLKTSVAALSRALRRLRARPASAQRA